MDFPPMVLPSGTHRNTDRVPWRYSVLFGPPRVTAPEGGRTLNLSAKGLSIQARTVYPPGTELRLVLQPHEEDGPFELMGTVVWSRQSKSLMGIRLTEWDPEFPAFVLRAEATLHPKERPTNPPPQSDPPKTDGPPEAPLAWPAGLRFPRFEEQLPVRYGLDGALDCKGFTGNISRSGLGVTGAQSFPPGTTLHAAITLPDGDVARIDGEVMWSHSARGNTAAMGLRLTTSDAAYARLVDEWERSH